ncbi:MAG: hypothetical protein BWK79_01040 [Beggiatoa sp. IS2]|nr:MAG: hypothetical protein BWK79_01040 [Beggiatoa sp. IS2]
MLSTVAKFSTRSLILIFILIGLGYILIQSRDTSFYRSWTTRLDLSYPQYAITDSLGDYYVIDNSQRRVLKTRSSGEVVYLLEGGSREVGKFYYAAEIVAGKEGDLYLLNYVLDKYGMFVVKEEVIHYTANGQLDRIVFQKEYDKKESTHIQRGEIFALKVDENFLYWLNVNGQAVAGYRMSTQSWKKELIGTIPLPEANIFISDVDWWQTQGIIYSSKQGRIITAHWQGPQHTVFDANLIEAKLGLVVPWEINYTQNGDIYFIDLAGLRIVKLEQNSVVTLLDYHVLNSQGIDSTDSMVYYRFSIDSQGGIVTTDDYKVIHVDQHGKVFNLIQTVDLPLKVLFIYYSGWPGLLIFIILSILLLWQIYTDVFNLRLSIILKQILVIAPIMAISIYLISNVVIGQFLQYYSEKSVNKMASLAQTIAMIVDGNLIKSITSQSDYMNENYRKIRKSLHDALNNNQDRWNESVYFVLYRVINEKLYGFMYIEDKIGIYHPFTWFSEEDSVYRKAYEGQVSTEQVTDITGDWLYGVAPVYDSEGKVVAILEIGSDQYSITQNIRDLQFKVIKMIIASTFIVVIALSFMTFMVLQSIRKLRNGVNKISQGEWNISVNLSSNDEISDLSLGFNKMSQHIYSYMNQVELLNKSYRRFVPEEFLRYLDRPSVLDVELGDQVQKEMTIMFADIRSFTTLSEQMTPKENFDFLNSYLSVVGPHIRKHHGFIDKYIGDAIMALFPHNADDALATAIDIELSIKKFNIKCLKKDRSFIIGIGIHTGLLMLGIIGEKERMEGTVISDSVNFASRLESLTKYYNASIIISEITYQCLQNPEKYSSRYLGRVMVKGKQQAVGIYEILDGEIDSVREQKMRTKEILEQGIRIYESQDIIEANRIFEQVLFHSPQEPVAKLYRIACNEILKEEDERWKENWTGAIKFKMK